MRDNTENTKLAENIQFHSTMKYNSSIYTLRVPVRDCTQWQDELMLNANANAEIQDI